MYEAGGIGRLMAPQLVDCSTSTATMLEEARAAESDADFVSKCCISLKECREAWTRLRICASCRIGAVQETRNLVQEANELVAIIASIVRNKRRAMPKRGTRRKPRLLNS
jgi:four helix bundle protein